MANHKSAEKRNRQRLVRTERSRALRSRMRSVLRQARDAIAEAVGAPAKSASAAELVRVASSLLDRAAAHAVLPKERASRLKSRLAIALHKSSQAKAPPSRAG
jgi:small subunit ribosomal protein S20